MSPIQSKIGPLKPMPRKIAVHKVWKHLYSKVEQWENLTDADIASMRDAVETISGVRREDTEKLPTLPHSEWSKVHVLLKKDNDAVYEPTYWNALLSDATVWSDTMTDTCRCMALTPNAICIVVVFDSTASWVLTAYRPHPPGSNVLMDEDARMNHAENHFTRRAGMTSNAIVEYAVQALNEATTPASTRSEMWFLAAAVGFGRWLGDVPEVGAVLPKSEQALLETPSALKAQLRDSLRWSSLKDEVSDALQKDDYDDFESTLIYAEELLAVAPVVGAEAEAEDFLKHARNLIPWVPREWSHVLHDAQRRLSIGVESHPVSAMWELVETSVLEAVLRDEERLPLPKATLVDTLIPRPDPWLAEALTGLQAGVKSAVAQGKGALAALADSISIDEPSPVMSGEAAPASPELHLARASGHRRVFVVSEGYPDGYDVTTYARKGTHIWDFDDVDKEVLVVVVYSASDIPGDTLAEVQSYAEKNETVELDYRLVQRPK